MSASTENFIKTIYIQSKLSGADTRLSTIAGQLNITNAAATDMAKNLFSKDLVNYTKYKPLELTETGFALALRVIRKHRLWESFLYKTLNLSLHEIHMEAEQLEHLTSDFLTDKIDEYLGNPTTDPHGDPIPVFNRETETDTSQILLSEADAGYMYEISRLFSREKDFFDFCNSNQMAIGSKIWVQNQYSSKKMTEIIINKNRILLNSEFTNIIYVKQIN